MIFIDDDFLISSCKKFIDYLSNEKIENMGDLDTRMNKRHYLDQGFVQINQNINVLGHVDYCLGYCFPNNPLIDVEIGASRHISGIYLSEEFGDYASYNNYEKFGDFSYKRFDNLDKFGDYDSYNGEIFNKIKNELNLIIDFYLTW